MSNFKTECIESLKKQGYTIKALDKGESKVLRHWKDNPTSDDHIENNYAVVLNKDNQFIIDIDDADFNHVLENYLDKTLVNQTGGDGRHYYFKDNVLRTEKYRIKTTKLYCGDEIIGDIKAKFGYVIGCGSIHANGNEYKKISTTNKVLEIDGYEILKILQDNGITTKQATTNKIKFSDGAQEGQRNNVCFKTACQFFERDADFDAGMKFMKTWNTTLNKKPLDDSEVESTVKSAWSRITRKELQFSGGDKIDNVADELQKSHKFHTLRKTEEILLYDGKIYNSYLSESLIKEETEKLIPQCTTHDRTEVINKIKAQTYCDIEDFDSDPNIITLENGILSLDNLELKPHTPKNLSRVLYPVEYNPPKHPIKDETIFDDVRENLKDTLFWKFLTNSFTIHGVLRKEDFETALEIMACVFVKRSIDDKNCMNLGDGDNGKSIFLAYIESLLGQNNVSHIALQEMVNDKFMLANLDGKSANIYADLEENELKYTGKIKTISSNEGIEVQKKHGQPFTLYPFSKLLFSCNRFPKVYDQGQGFFRRWIILKWERNFEKDPERIEHLKDTLTSNQEEKNLVFSCLVSIANRLNKVGKFSHSKDWKTVQKEWNENADSLDFFVSNYIIDSDKNKTKRETYQFYKKIMLEKGETPMGIGQFSKAFAEYYDEDRSSVAREWANIDFKIPTQSTLNEVDANE